MYDLKVFKKQVGFGEDKIERKKTIWVLSALLVCRVTIFLWSVCVCVFAGRGRHVYVTQSDCTDSCQHNFCVCACVCVWSVNLCEGEPGVLLTRGLSDWCVKACVCVCVCVHCHASILFLLSPSILCGVFHWLVRSPLLDPCRNDHRKQGKKCGKIL